MGGELLTPLVGTKQESMSSAQLSADTLLVDCNGCFSQFLEDNPNVLGLAWDHRHIALFGDVIESSCAGLEAILRPGQAERACDRTWMAIWAHELGHVVGLVDLGAPMQEPHRELGGTHHCDDESCVMWRTHDGSASSKHHGQHASLDCASLSSSTGACCRSRT